MTNKLSLQEVHGREYYQPASKLQEVVPVSTNIIHEFGSRITINGTPEMDKLGSLLHHCLALLLTKPDIDREIIENIINSQQAGSIQTDQILSQVNALRDWMDITYPRAKIHTELPISLTLDNGSLQQGAIDLALEMEDGWVVIDHKSNPQPRDKWDEIAAKHAAQLYAYSDAIEKLTGSKVLKKIIHFTVGGGLIELS